MLLCRLFRSVTLQKFASGHMQKSYLDSGRHTVRFAEGWSLRELSKNAVEHTKTSDSVHSQEPDCRFAVLFSSVRSKKSRSSIRTKAIWTVDSTPFAERLFGQWTAHPTYTPSHRGNSVSCLEHKKKPPKGGFLTKSI